MSSREMMTLFLLIICFSTVILPVPNNAKRVGEVDIPAYREKVKQMFYHAYEGYLTHAYPYDELQPLTCGGLDTWGSYSLTLIDAMDTLAVMGNFSEFRRIADILIDKGESFFDIDINVSVFETNIRIVGGLLSAHLMMKRAGMVLEPSWPCSGPLLRMADNIARKILPAFDTPTGMPYGTVNLRYGVPKGETTITCTAGVGTFIVEFGSLSRLTGDPIFEKTALRAIRALWKYRSPLGMLGNHIDVSDGKWTALDFGIGGGVDSYFEYLVKGAIMFNIPELLHMFREYETSINKYLKRDDWFMWAQMNKGSITLPMFTSLDGYWPGIKGMLGDLDEAMKTMHNFHQVWRQFGFTPEYYNIPKAEVHQGREGYPLRPEIVESAMYLYRATKDPYLLEIGVDIVEAIEHSARTSCGYATVKDVRDHRLEDRMESFFLAETTKYLYLLFDPDNFIHSNGSTGDLIHTPSGKCVTEAGGYVFNTEAHPIDLASVHCCSAAKKEEDQVLQEFHDNLDLLSILDLVKNDQQDWIVLPKKRKKMKEAYGGSDFETEQRKMQEEERLTEEMEEHVEELNADEGEEEGDGYNDEDFKEFEDSDDVQEWGKKDLEADINEVKRDFLAAAKKQEEKKHLHVVDMTSFTEMERNLTRVLMKELQTEVLLKNISTKLAERLRQQYKETDFEHIANGVAKKILDAQNNPIENVDEDKDKTDQKTKDSKENELKDSERIVKNDTDNNDPQTNVGGEGEIPETITNTNKIFDTDPKLSTLEDSMEADPSIKTSDRPTQDTEKKQEIHIEISSAEDIQQLLKEQQNSGKDEKKVVLLHLDTNKNIQASKDANKPSDTTGSFSEEPESQTLEKSEDSSAKSNMDESNKVPNPALERFKSHIELQIQNHEQKQQKSQTQTIPSTNIPGTRTPSPLENKRSNLVSITNKILSIFSRSSGSESEETQPERTPSIAGLYAALANYPLSYFHDPLAMHCPAQPFHSRISIYGEMFSDE